MKYENTTAIDKILQMKKRLKIVQGGSSAGKTIAILLIIIDKAQTDDSKRLYSVVSETMPHLKRGAIRDFLNIMDGHGYFKQERWNMTNSIYTFETGSQIEFFSADNSDKVRGPRRDDLFLNEANNISYETYIQLVIRTNRDIYIDYNPVSEFWVHQQIIPNADHDFIILNYKDNEGLPESIVTELESHMHNVEWWKVYGLGELGMTQERIYPPWEQLDEIPEDARLRVKGLDFGYTNDPTALVDIHEWNNAYILDEQLYEKGLLNNQIVKIIGKNTVITVGDSAEPKSIAEIAMHGVSIIGSKKGKGSISHGINVVQSKKIYVTKRSLNIIKENRNYIFIADKNGIITNEPRDLFNHAMDAIRYALAFLNPVVEEEELYIQPDYEAPSIGTKQSMGTPILTIQQGSPVGGSHKDRMMALRNMAKPTESTYETDTPWQKPGL